MPNYQTKCEHIYVFHGVIRLKEGKLGFLLKLIIAD